MRARVIGVLLSVAIGLVPEAARADGESEEAAATPPSPPAPPAAAPPPSHRPPESATQVVEYRPARHDDEEAAGSLHLRLAFNAAAGGGARFRGDSSMVGAGAAAARPELLLANRRFAAGVYGEAGWLASSDASFGGGASFALAVSRTAVVGPFGGAFGYERHDGWRAGFAAGVLLAAHGVDGSVFDDTQGFRLELRHDLASEPARAVLLTYQFNPLRVLAAVLFAANMR